MTDTEKTLNSGDAEAIYQANDVSFGQADENSSQNLKQDDTDAPEIPFEEALEAILFAAGHAVPYSTIARVLNLTPSKVKSKVYDYALRYNDYNGALQRGVMLLAYPDECQLCTKEAYLPQIRDALGVRKSGTLSTAAMETLAVVAYNQPVTRVFVDTIRKVDSSYAMNSLIDRGLIECVGRLDVPGRPMQYGTTSDFLRCFGIDDISKLPPTSEELVNMFSKIKNEAQGDGEATAEAENQLTMDLDAGITESAEDLHNENTNQPENPQDDIEDYEEHSAEDDFVDID